MTRLQLAPASLAERSSQFPSRLKAPHPLSLSVAGQEEQCPGFQESDFQEFCYVF